MTDPINPFEGRLALVTGASRGIGAATAEALAAGGAHVMLVARNSQSLEEVEERIHAAGGNATIAPLDLTDGTSIGKLAGAIAERWDKLDILVLNAAMLGSLTPVQDIDPKEYSRIMSLNVLANQALVAAFDGLLRKSDRAEVVALTSSVGAEPRAFWGAYGSSKAALENLLGAYADETDIHQVAPRPHRRSRRDPDADAGFGLSGRGTGILKAAGSRGRSNCRPPAIRCADRRDDPGRELGQGEASQPPKRIVFKQFQLDPLADLQPVDRDPRNHRRLADLDPRAALVEVGDAAFEGFADPSFERDRLGQLDCGAVDLRGLRVGPVHHQRQLGESFTDPVGHRPGHWRSPAPPRIT